MANTKKAATKKAATPEVKPSVQEKKQFVISKAMIGKGITINVTFKNGRTAKYNHDDAVKAMQEQRNLDDMGCWEKYGNYTSSKSIPAPVAGLKETVYDKSNEIKPEKQEDKEAA